MCMMCEGYTEEEMLAHWLSIIDDRGALVLAVSDARMPWAYSVGLRWNFDHPELIAVHPDWSKAQDVVSHAVDDIADGRRLKVGDRYVAPCGGRATVRPVHHANASGEWFSRWPQLARASGHRQTSLRALQLVLDCRCAECSLQTSLQRRSRA